MLTRRQASINRNPHAKLVCIPTDVLQFVVAEMLSTRDLARLAETSTSINGIIKSNPRSDYNSIVKGFQLWRGNHQWRHLFNWSIDLYCKEPFSMMQVYLGIGVNLLTPAFIVRELFTWRLFQHWNRAIRLILAGYIKVDKLHDEDSTDYRLSLLLDTECIFEAVHEGLLTPAMLQSNDIRRLAYLLQHPDGLQVLREGLFSQKILLDERLDWVHWTVLLMGPTVALAYLCKQHKGTLEATGGPLLLEIQVTVDPTTPQSAIQAMQDYLDAISIHMAAPARILIASAGDSMEE